jgi:hypothetical protein
MIIKLLAFSYNIDMAWRVIFEIICNNSMRLSILDAICMLISKCGYGLMGRLGLLYVEKGD